jgi:hypothetical protein
MSKIVFCLMLFTNSVNAFSGCMYSFGAKSHVSVKGSTSTGIPFKSCHKIHLEARQGNNDEFWEAQRAIAQSMAETLNKEESMTKE